MKYAYTLNFEMPGCEVRKVEEVHEEWDVKDRKTGEKTGDVGHRDYLLLLVDDVDLNRVVFKDRHFERKDFYRRGQVGTFRIAVSIEDDFKPELKSIEVLDFKEDSDE